MVNICVDVGNSRTKIGIYQGNELLEILFIQVNSLLIELTQIHKTYAVNKIILASVGNIPNEILYQLKANFKLVILNHQLHLPLKIKYETPETLGIDRLCVSVGANILYPNQNILIIDSGSCITYDIITQNNDYLGGAISPGFIMRFKALKHYTAKLPLIQYDYKEPIAITGATTEKAIKSGVIYGILNEIDGIINSYREKYTDLTVILTGGDTEFLANHLKNIIFAQPYFLLQSMNLWYNYIKNYD